MPEIVQGQLLVHGETRHSAAHLFRVSLSTYIVPDVSRDQVNQRSQAFHLSPQDCNRPGIKRLTGVSDIGQGPSSAAFAIDFV